MEVGVCGMNFATLKGLTIPEGNVTKITDASGRVLWKAIPATAIVTIENDLDQAFEIYYHNPASGSIVYMSNAGTYELPNGTTLTMVVYPHGGCWGSIELNDEDVASGEEGKRVGYEYTLNGDITIECLFECPDDIIYITET